jgi:hypothetical protein
MGEDAEDDEYYTDAERKKRQAKFRTARPGDCLMCPFQCDWCHFANLKGRAPTPTEEGKPLMVAIRRANLDAFWAREPGTVEQNYRQLAQVEKAAAALGLEDPLRGYPRGPFKLEDEWGMTGAVCFLTRTLDPGINAPQVQFGTARKMGAFFTNIHGTTPAGAAALTTMGEGKGSLLFTDAPTKGPWHRRFIEGSHRRMGDKTMKDVALSIKELLKLIEIWEEEWEEASEAGDTTRCLYIARIAFAVVTGFAGGFRGEEIVKADLKKTEAMREESLRQNPPYT